jgi:NAD(P)-dependent dehydrogenase (short-subunit alcohol dehydrogenase family)
LDHEEHLHEMKTALVTGGSGSIGRAIVERLVKDGLHVTFQFHSDETGAASLARETGATPLRMDLLSSAVGREPLAFDVLVNSAGVLLTKTSIEQVSDNEMEKTLAVNLWAPFRLLRSVVPTMIDRGWGRIINVGSIYAQRGTSNNSSYNISKHALLGMTRSASWDLAKHGITVNQVDPSAVESRIIDDLATRYAASGTTTEQEYKQAIADAIPARRLAAPADIAGAVSFLASEDSSFLTGQGIAVDGGLIA